MADLHEVISRYPGDGELAAMVSVLRGISQRFAARWEHPTVARTAVSTRRCITRLSGEITLDCDVLTVHGVVVFTATPGTPDADKLAVLNVVGSQDFSRTSIE